MSKLLIKVNGNIEKISKYQKKMKSMSYIIKHPEKGYLVKYDPQGSIWSTRERAAYDFYDLEFAEKVQAKLPGSKIEVYESVL